MQKYSPRVRKIFGEQPIISGVPLLLLSAVQD